MQSRLVYLLLSDAFFPFAPPSIHMKYGICPLVLISQKYSSTQMAWLDANVANANELLP